MKHLKHFEAKQVKNTEEELKVICDGFLQELIDTGVEFKNDYCREYPDGSYVYQLDIDYGFNQTVYELNDLNSLVENHDAKYKLQHDVYLAIIRITKKIAAEGYPNTKLFTRDGMVFQIQVKI